MLRTRAPGWLCMRTECSPSQTNQTGIGSGAPRGETVVSQTTTSSRRWRRGTSPEVGALVDHDRMIRPGDGVGRVQF